MIKAYLAVISTIYEGEDIEVRYCIFEDQVLLRKESAIMEYKKPAIVGQVAFIMLLSELEKFLDKEILIIVNDAALYEFVRGTSTTKNKDVLKMGRETRKELGKFKNVKIKDVHSDREEFAKWNEVLQPK